MGKTMFLCLLLIFSLLQACKKEKISVNNNGGITLNGGKGGSLYLAIFPTYKGKGIASRIFMKYAANTRPADTTLYDEKYNTMTEPGYGPHAHFSALKAGTYYIYIRSNSGNYSADTVLNLTDSSPKSQDIYKEMK